MKTIYDFSGQPLKWEQPSALKMEYELRSQSEQLATLRFRSSFGSFATADCSNGCWTFKRVGFFQTRVTIRPCQSEVEIASFKNNTWKGGGTLLLADGRRLQANTNFWQTSYDFRTESGSPLIVFRSGGVFHISAEVDILPEAAAMPELPWLVILGWYLVIMLRNDSSVATAV